jgi:hypothetical protein
MRPSLALAATLALAGCATAPAAKEDATLPAAESGVKLEEVVGFWSGDWGNLVLKQFGETVMGAYAHRDGTLLCRFEKGTLVGWWTEAPSREPDGDAGDLEIHFVKKGGVLTLLGRYRHGTSGPWLEEWNLKRLPDEPPPELEARFAETALFHPHP